MWRWSYAFFPTQFFTAGKSIYKISKHFSFSLVFLVLVENVFILIKVFIRISSSFSNWCWLIWINLIVVVRSIFNVLESFNLLLTRLPFFSKNPSIFLSCFNMDVIIYLQIPQIIHLSRRIIFPLIVENPSSTNIFDDFYLLRLLIFVLVFLDLLKIAFRNWSLSTSFINTSSGVYINATSPM